MKVKIESVSGIAMNSMQRGSERPDSWKATTDGTLFGVNSPTMKPTDASMATRLCLISHSRRNLTRPSLAPVVKPSGSKKPSGALTPGSALTSKGAAVATIDGAGARALVVAVECSMIGDDKDAKGESRKRRPDRMLCSRPLLRTVGACC